MSEPTSGIAASCSAGSNAIACAGLVGTISSIDPGIFLASFAGAVIFVLSQDEVPVYKRIIYLLVSIIGGIALSRLLDTLTPVTLIFPREAGAFIFAALCVKILNSALAVNSLRDFISAVRAISTAAVSVISAVASVLKGGKK